MVKIYLVLFLSLFGAGEAWGQSGVNWMELEGRVRTAEQLNGTDERLADIGETAWRGRDYIGWARARFDRMLIRDRRTEDSFYFRNSAFIDSLLAAESIPQQLRPLLHLMQAERLAGFVNRPLKFNRARYETPDLPINYAALPVRVLDSITQQHFQLAKLGSPLLDTAEPRTLFWLSSTPQSLLFKPAWRDIVEADLIDYILKSFGSYNAWKNSKGRWLGLSSPAFIDTLAASTFGSPAASLFSEWLRSRSDDRHVYYFIEALARKSLYQNYSYDTAVTNVYESYLLNHTRDTLPEVKAFAIYELCVSWNQENSQLEEWRMRGYGENDHHTLRPSLKHTPATILRLYDDNRELFSVYPHFGKVLEAMRARILWVKIRMSIPHSNFPNEPIHADVTYKNTPHLYYRVVRVGQYETPPIVPEKRIAYLLTKPVIRDTVVDMPAAGDHGLHLQTVTLSGLPAGRYYLLFTGSSFAGTDGEIAALEFGVSGMVLLHTDENVIHLLDKRSGFPMAGVKVEGLEKEKILRSGLTDEKGFIQLTNEDIDEASASFRGDTVTADVGYSEEAVDPDDEKTKEDALEFYNDKLRIFLFTDRSIYRPGQTVHYKAILTTSNIRTADAMLFTRRNLRYRAGKDGLDSWLREHKPFLYLEDPNSREIDSIAIRPDDYGSFSGSFVIPKDGVTGDWELSTAQDKTGGTFRVEEYKRPTFELKVIPPDKSYLPGEPIEFKIKARSFTGASLANTVIRYSVSRDQIRLTDSTATLNADGFFTIHVDDTAAYRHPEPDSILWRLYYRLTATATDITGESHDADGHLEASNRPVNIIAPSGAIYLLNDTPLINIKTKDINGLVIGKLLQVKVYKKLATDLDETERKDLVYTTTINTGEYEKLRLSADHWQAGEYEIVLECREQGRLLGERKVSWTVLDLHSAGWPIASPLLIYLPANDVNRGDRLRFYTGSRFDSSYTLVNIKYDAVRHGRLTPVSIFLDRYTRQGLEAWDWTIPQDATDRVLITSLIVRNGEVYRKSEWVWVNVPSERPMIRIERFREHLSPGETTKFSVSVRTGNTAIAAQVMSTIYDASLDRLEPHEWRAPMISNRPQVENSWPNELNSKIGESVSGPLPAEREIRENRPAWSEEFQPVSDPVLALEGRVSGLSFGFAGGLDDVVVIGYGGTKRMLTGAVVTIRGTNSLSSMDSHILVILDGVEYKDDIKKINAQSITQGIVLKGAEATALYGARAANGVLLLSTKGDIKLPEALQEPLVRIRKNFNETAFFSPAIAGDKKGIYSFEFTAPESVTEWEWKIMAHTKKALFAYAEKKFVTRLPLMIQPHLPRFVYQGDRIILKSRISNLDTSAMSGRVRCLLEDAVTGENLTTRLLDKQDVPFSAAAGGNASVAFALHVPTGLLHPVRITLKAMTTEFADAEEHELPVLSTRVLARRAFAFDLAANHDTVVRLPEVAPGDSLLGIGVAVTATPQTALLNGLPWLANYSYDCAEQTFNKMLAHITALQLMRTDTGLQSAYAHSGSDSTAGFRQPDEPALRSMPWLDLTGKTERQQRQLRVLLDTFGTITAIETHLKRLYGLQKSDGGLAWFDGGESNPYISAYVLMGFGRIRREAWRPASTTMAPDKLDGFLSALVRYCDDVYSTDPDLDYIYARSFWLDSYPLTELQRSKIKSYLAKQWDHANSSWLYSRALLIITSITYFDPGDVIYKKASELLEDIRQLAISDENGIRWKELADADDLTMSGEETIGMLCEAFGRSPGYGNLRAGILKWLLQVQTEHHWSSTKATAAAIDLLKQGNRSVVGAIPSLTATIGDSAYRLSAGVLAGMPFVYVSSGASGPVGLRRGGMTAVGGHLIQYYFTDPDRLRELNTTVKLNKRLFRYNDSSVSWEPLSERPVLHIADRIKVVLTLETARPLRYVYIDDKRAASFEPLDVRSGYSYASGFGLYQSIRDAGCQFFCDFIPSGRWEISYELRAEHEGEFSSGAAMLQCMYKPEVSAYSQAGAVEVRR